MVCVPIFLQAKQGKVDMENYKHLPEVFRGIKRLRYFAKGDFLRNEKISRIAWSCLTIYGDAWHHASGEYQKLKMKRYRTNKRIKTIFDYNERVYFVTLTFSDEFLEKCSIKTLLRYSREFLQSHCNDYFANGDFGSRNGRFHVHAVCGDPHELETWKYGIVNFKLANSESKDKLRLARYVAKLSNHSLKDSAIKPFGKRGMVCVSEKKLDNLPF